MATSTRVHVLSAIPRITQVLRNKLPDAEVIVVNPKGNGGQVLPESEIAKLQDAKVLLVDNHLLLKILDHVPNMRWAQGTWAGVETLVAALKDKPKPAFPFSRMVGPGFSQLMAEYTIGWIINHERGWLDVHQNQLTNAWNQRNKIGDYRSLQELTVGVLGLGNIGKEVAKSVKTFRSTVHAFTRTPPSAENMSPDVDKYWHTGELEAFLSHCDYIVSIMPSTPDTRGMLGNDILKNAKENAVLINIGRGDIISEKDIIKSLDAGWIGAAILDVFNEEPLPSDSPLWSHPKVVITPHVAGISKAEDVVDTFVMNFKRYNENLPVLYTVSWNDGY